MTEAPVGRWWNPGLVLVLATASGGCEPPDRPPSLPPPVFEEGVEVPVSDTLRTVRIAPGVLYRYLWFPEGPWAAHILEADLSRCEVGLVVLPSTPASGDETGRSRVTDLFDSGPSGIVAAVNGDFFTPEGLPLGPEVAGGGVRSLRERAALAWRPGSDPWVGTPILLGDTALAVGWALRFADPGIEVAVVGGDPVLLAGGERWGDLGVRERPDFAAVRHPRTAVAYDSERGRLWLVVIDGRRPGYSEGMTLPELTGFLERLGAREALNLDGGGSSVMVVAGRVMNRPSDTHGERAVANALALRHTLDFCPRIRGLEAEVP